MLTEPAVGNTFFGREKILSILEKRVSALKGGYRQNIALTGPMLSGKSSILDSLKVFTLLNSPFSNRIGYAAISPNAVSGDHQKGINFLDQIPS